MTAPVLFEKGYKLEVEIQQKEDTEFRLKEVRIYHFNDVWEARNAYETFFSRNVDVEIEYTDKRIIMIGDEKLMVFTQEYIYSYSSLEEAEKKKENLVNDYMDRVSYDFRMRREVQEMEKRKVKTSVDLASERKKILQTTFEEMGMQNRTVVRFKRFGISNLEELFSFWERKQAMSESGWPCDGKWLSSTMLDELEELLEKHKWAWVLRDYEFESESLQVEGVFCN